MKKRLIAISVAVMVVGIFLALIVSVVLRNKDEKPLGKLSSLRDITTTAKNFTLSYGSYPPDAVWDVSSFEEKNDLTWKGEGFFDDRIAHDGKTSLGLISNNGQQVSTYVEDIPPPDNFEDLTVVAYVTDVNDMESAAIFLGSKENPHAYTFPVTNILNEWSVIIANRAQFTFENPERPLPWSQVNRIEFSMTSRPGKTVILNLDHLQFIKILKYREDWNVNSFSFLSLAKSHDRIGVLARGFGTSIATLRAIPTAKDFVYRVKLLQESNKKTGVFFRGDARSGYGYVFWLGGVEKNTWGLFVRTEGVTELLDTGEFTNVQFYEAQPVWIEVRATGETIDIALSLDGEHFTSVEQVKDTTLLSGGVGIFAEGGAKTIFNDFSFSQ